MSPVRRPRVANATVAAAIAGCLVLTGCSGDSQSSDPGTRHSAASSEATDAGTPLEDIDTTALVVPRAPFCDRIDAGAVRRALGEEAADVSAYRSGQRIRISDDVADVVHEFGCRWTAGDQTAEAWVFAPPITRKRAMALQRQVEGSTACAGKVAAPQFGRPSAACRSGTPQGGETMTFHGLFGDAWLTCSLTLTEVPDPELTDRAGTWCAAVATGAADL